MGQADALLLTEVYAAGEPPIVAADGRALARALRVAGKVEPVFVDDVAALPAAIADFVRDGDVVIVMGAGTIGAVPQQVVDLAGSSMTHRHEPRQGRGADGRQQRRARGLADVGRRRAAGAAVQGVDAHAFDPAERGLHDLKAEGFERVFIALHGRHGEDGTVQGALELLGIPTPAPA
jgi:hypothetical protein